MYDSDSESTTQERRRVNSIHKLFIDGAFDASPNRSKMYDSDSDSTTQERRRVNSIHKLFIDGAFDAKMALTIIMFTVYTIIKAISLIEWPMLNFCVVLCILGFLIADIITRMMRNNHVSSHHISNVEIFLKRRRGPIFTVIILVSALILVLYLLVPPLHYNITPLVSSSVMTLSFIFGAVYPVLVQKTVTLYICKNKYGDKGCVMMRTALLNGFVSSLLVVGFILLGFVFLYVMIGTHVIGEWHAFLNPNVIPFYMIGFGLGITFSTLFLHVMPVVFNEDDNLDKSRNHVPLTEENISGDLLECISVGMLCSIILASTITSNARLPSSLFVMFPFVMCSLDFIVVTSLVVYVMYKLCPYRKPIELLKAGTLINVLLNVIMFYFMTNTFLYVPGSPEAVTRFFFCGVMGIGFLPLTLLLTMTTTTPQKIQQIIIPFVIFLTSYYNGSTSGIEHFQTHEPSGGMLGVSFTTMGMLSGSGFMLTLDLLKPIVENVGGDEERAAAAASESSDRVADHHESIGKIVKVWTNTFLLGIGSMISLLLLSTSFLFVSVELFVVLCLHSGLFVWKHLNVHHKVL